jgi:hypothetical protein
VNAADWLPQVMSDIFQIDIDIYDGQRPGGGFRTNNGCGQRIGLGRVNNNHYISLNGDLETAWLAEQQAILRIGVDLEQQKLDLLQGKSIKVNPQLIQYFQQKLTLESQSLLLNSDFKLRQLIQARKIGEYLMDQIQGSATGNILKVLNEVKEEVRQEVLEALKPKELKALWQAIERLEGYEDLKKGIWDIQEEPTCLVLYKGSIFR